ncbi:MAG: bile acid:sodium symporter family protein [Paracoccus sp. (in: a-proteobacteria)]
MDILIAVVLGLMLFALGTSLTLYDFQRIFKQKKAVGLGLFLQMVLLPVLAFLLALTAPIAGVYKVGIVLVAICPGGATSNFISYLLKADTALSVSLTMINSFLIVFSIPLLTGFALQLFMGDSLSVHLSITQTLTDMLLMLVLPILLGMFVRKFSPKKVIRLQKPLKIIASLLLAGVFILKFLGDNSDKAIDSSIIFNLLPYLLVLHFSGMIGSFFIAKNRLKENTSALTIGIEVGLQNTALALWVVAKFLPDDAMGHPALVYALFSFFTTLGFGFSILYGKIRLKMDK